MAGTFQDRLVTELRLASATTIAEAQAVLERFLPRFNARFAVAARQREPAWRPARPGTRPRGHPRLQAHPHRRARSSTTGARCSCCPHRSGPATPGRAWTCWSDGELAVRHQGETIPSRLAPPRSGVLRERRSELAFDPALERIASGLGPSGGPPRPQAHPATTNGTIVNAGCAHRPALADREPGGALEGDSTGPPAGTLDARHRPAARHLTQHHQEVRRAGGPPGRQGAASSTISDQPNGHVR